MQLSWKAEQSAHNIESNAYLAKANPDYRDWEITTLYYSAVHMIDVYLLLAANMAVNTHEQRKKLVRKNLAPVYDDYYSLECLSRKARYDSPYQKLTPEEVGKAANCNRAISAHVKTRLHDLGHDAALMRDDGHPEHLR